MDTNQIEHTCPECARKKQASLEHEEMSFALLLALMPLVVLTLFGQIGLL